MSFPISGPVTITVSLSSSLPEEDETEDDAQDAVFASPSSDSFRNDGKIFKCSLCEETFTRRSNMRRHHSRRHHGEPMVEEFSTNRSKCLFADCDKLFYHKSSMLNHMKEEHQFEVTTSHLSFESEKEFFDWKEKEEMANCVYFTKQNGDTEGKLIKYSYYICQRDGSAQSHRPQGEPDRKTDRRNGKGRVKTGITCPARMSVKTNTKTGMVDVTYIRSHSHKPSFEDTLHHPIPKPIRDGLQLEEKDKRYVTTLGKVLAQIDEDSWPKTIDSTSTPVESYDGILQSTGHLLESTKQDLSKIQDILQNENIVWSVLPHISNTLKRLLSECSAEIEADEMIQLQPVKKAKKRKSSLRVFKGLTAPERKELVESLLPHYGQLSSSELPTKKSNFSSKNINVSGIENNFEPEPKDVPPSPEKAQLYNTSQPTIYSESF